MSTDPNRKQWNSTLRPVALRKIGQPKPQPMRQRKKPLSLKEAMDRFNIVTAAALGEPKKIKAKKYRKPIKKRAANNTGWVDVAKEMWDAFPGAHCEACYRNLGSDFSPTFYHHLLHRGSYRKYKRDPRNLARLCLECHNKVHKTPIDKMDPTQVSNTGWPALYFRLVSLRDEANGINKPA